MSLRYLTLMAALGLLFAAGCAEPEAPADAAAPDTTAADTVAAPEPEAAGIEDPLLPVREVPLGSTYDEVAGRIPGVSELAPETAGADLAEAFAPVRVFDREVRLELNFEDERLYSLYYRPDAMPCDSAEARYEALQEAYDARVGAHREETQDEGGYAARTSYWSGDGFDVAATLSRQGEACRISWGLQRPAGAAR